MALIKLTAFLDQISGKVNGSVFARNKGGAYVRSKSNPTNPQTNLQMGVRSVFSSISQAWRNLTDAQRNAWASISDSLPYQNKLGDTRTLSGFALHQQTNLNLQTVNSPMVSAPPPVRSIGSVAEITSLAMTPTGTDLVGFVNGADPDDQVVIFATPPVSPGIKNYKKYLRLLTIDTPDNLENGLDLTAQYASTFSTPVVGQRVGFKLVIINSVSGQASASYFTDVIVGL